MAKKIIRLVLLAMALAFGMAVVGCDDGSTNGNENGKSNGNGTGGNGNTQPKTITITGITGITGNLDTVSIVIIDEAPVATGDVEISNGSVTVPLFNVDQDYQKTDVPWTGNGSYWIQLIISYSQGGVSADWYFYTNGQSFQELGINIEIWDVWEKLPKYNITGANSAIAFNRFANSLN